MAIKQKARVTKSKLKSKITSRLQLRILGLSIMGAVLVFVALPFSAVVMPGCYKDGEGP